MLSTFWQPESDSRRSRGQRSESASAEDDVTCFIQYSEQCSSARPQRSAASLTPASVTPWQPSSVSERSAEGF